MKKRIALLLMMFLITKSSLVVANDNNSTHHARPKFKEVALFAYGLGLGTGILPIFMGYTGEVLLALDNCCNSKLQCTLLTATFASGMATGMSILCWILDKATNINKM